MNPNTVAALITRAQSGGDAYGNVTYTETAVAHPALYWPGGSAETVKGQDQVVWHASVCLPTGTVVTAVDEVIPQAVTDASGNLILDGDGKAQGERFQIDGEPQTWPANPFTGIQGPFTVVLTLTRTTG